MWRYAKLGGPVRVGGLASLVEIVQSVKRYVDSKLITHLLNVSLAFVRPSLLW
jgi:hypothetical protein